MSGWVITGFNVALTVVNVLVMRSAWRLWKQARS